MLLATLPLWWFAGVELVLYFRTMYLLLSPRLPHQKVDVLYAIFSSVMLLMLTIWVATQAIFGEKMWLEDAGYPGGPDAYWAANNADWYMDFGTTAITVLQLMTDGLMVRIGSRTEWKGGMLT